MKKPTYSCLKITTAVAAASLLGACTTLPKAAMDAPPPTQEQVASVNQGSGFNDDHQTKRTTLPPGWHLISFSDFMNQYRGSAFAATESWDGKTHHLVWDKNYDIHISGKDKSPEYVWTIEDSSGSLQKIGEDPKYLNGKFFIGKIGSGWDVCAVATNGKTTALWYTHGPYLEVLGPPVPLPNDKAG